MPGERKNGEKNIRMLKNVTKSVTRHLIIGLRNSKKQDKYILPPKIHTPGHILFKLLKSKEKILKVAREGKTYYRQRNKNKDYNKLSVRSFAIKKTMEWQLENVERKKLPSENILHK